MSIIRKHDDIDLEKYLPEFIRKDPTIGTVLTVESKEHKVQAKVLDDVFDQLFIDSATWGLERYERILGLTPKATDDYAQRRNRILLYLQQKVTTTKEFLRKLASRYVTEDSTIQVIEDNPHYSFRITDDAGKILYFDDLWDAVETYKPAHLGWRFVIQRHFLTEIFVGFVHGRVGRGTMLPDTSIVEDPDAFTGKIGLFRVGRSHAGMP